MKKLLVFLLTFTFSIGLIGCNSSTDTEDLYKLIEQHKQLDRLGDFEFSYEQIYKLAEETYINPEYFIKDSNQILRKGNLSIIIGDLKGLTDAKKEEYKKLAKETKKELEKSFIDFKETIKLSKIYEDKEHNWKYIYEHKVVSFNDTVRNRRGYINERYRLKQEDGKWKILAIDGTQRQYLEDRDKDLNEQEMVEQLGFNTFNNEPVEYIKTLE